MKSWELNASGLCDQPSNQTGGWTMPSRPGGREDALAWSLTFSWEERRWEGRANDSQTITSGREDGYVNNVCDKRKQSCIK